MKKQLIILFVFTVYFMNGQNLADTIPICKNSISLEFLGTSCDILSVHYDRIIKKKPNTFYNIDVGYGYMPYLSSYKSNQVSGTSIAIDWNNKLYRKNHITGGIGIAYSDGLFQYGLSDETKKSHKAIYGSIRLGYKFQKTTKGLFLKLIASPIFRIYEFSYLPYSAPSVFPLIGIGVGYSF